jgi:hypothetical protein
MIEKGVIFEGQCKMENPAAGAGQASASVAAVPQL